MAGRIEAIGCNVRQFKPDDEVFGFLPSATGRGTFAEYVCAKESLIALKPANLTFEQAAAVPEVRPLARYDQFLVSFYQRKFADAERYAQESVAALPTANSVTGLAMVELTWRGLPEEALRVLAAAPGSVPHGSRRCRRSPARWDRSRIQPRKAP